MLEINIINIHIRESFSVVEINNGGRDLRHAKRNVINFIRVTLHYRILPTQGMLIIFNSSPVALFCFPRSLSPYAVSGPALASHNYFRLHECRRPSYVVMIIETTN